MKKLPEVNCLLKIWIIVIIVLNPMAVFSTNIHGSTFKTNSYVSGELYEGGFAIAKNGQLSSILVDETDYSGVKKVAGHLQSDIKLVTGKEPVIVYDTTGIKADYVIIIGTIGKSALINALIERGKIKVDDVQGKWETSLIQVVDHPFPGIGKGLIIAGSDKRGTIFGMFDLSAQIGVSPWNWWADVPVEPRSEIYVKLGRYNLGEPKVKYRGIFINDEEPALGNVVLYVLPNHDMFRILHPCLEPNDPV